MFCLRFQGGLYLYTIGVPIIMILFQACISYGSRIDGRWPGPVRVSY